VDPNRLLKKCSRRRERGDNRSGKLSTTIFQTNAFKDSTTIPTLVIKLTPPGWLGNADTNHHEQTHNRRHLLVAVIVITALSAWASEPGIALGLIATKEKSNKITEIPELIDLRDAVVTIDSMDRQKEIVGKIIKQKGDYGLAGSGKSAAAPPSPAKKRARFGSKDEAVAGTCPTQKPPPS